MKKRPDIVNKSQTACLSRKLFPQALTTKTFQTCMSNTMDKAHLHFDATWYLWLYGDVHELIAQGKWSSGLEHYLAIGSKEGRSPNPVMDEGWYLTTYPDVREAVESGRLPSGASHFASTGVHEGRQPSRYFNEGWYLENHPDVQALIRDGAYESGYHHFVRRGMTEGKLPGPAFPEKEYLHSNPAAASDVKGGAFRSGFEHYVRYGMLNGSHEPMAGELEQEKARQHSRSFHVFRAERELDRFMQSDGRLDFTPTCTPKVAVVIVVHNAAGQVLQCLSALSRNTDMDVELIILDNASNLATQELLHRVSGARIIRHQRNLHFLRAANRGANLASAPTLLFLNSDAAVLPGALEAALETLENNETAGAVGAKLIYPDGLLEEAGCGLTANGSPYGYGCGQSPFDSRFQCLRESLYTSGAFLLTPRALFKQLGGFDEVYSPAYFEDADYCLRLRAIGFITLVDPRCNAVHFGRGSGSRSPTTSAIFAKNQVIFRGRHRGVLAAAPHSPQGNLRLPETGHHPSRVLMIEDAPPVAMLGSGLPRTVAIVHALIELGYEVTCFSMNGLHAKENEIRESMPLQVECIVDRTPEDLADFLRERPGAYDVLWVSRPHNLCRIRDIKATNESLLHGMQLIYDAEAIFAERELSLAKLRGDGTEYRRLSNELEKELTQAFMADAVMAVSAADQQRFQGLGIPAFNVGHSIQSRDEAPGPRGRLGLLFVGAVHSKDSPNFDSLAWFVEQVFPRLRTTTTGITLTIVGSWTIDFPDRWRIEGIEFIGAVDNLTPYYDKARVFVAPTRYGAGVPLKVIEAAANGLPVCATELLARQLEWQGDCMASSPPDAEQFASTILRTYSDEEAWQRIRQSALATVKSIYSPETFRQSIAAAISPAKSRQNPRFARDAMEQGENAKGRTSRQPVILLFEGRTGSTHLSHLLSQHPEMEFFGEHLASLYQKGWRVQQNWINDVYDHLAEQQIATPDTSTLRCIGFKTKLRDVRDPDLLRELLIERDVQVIRMRRRNRIKQAISSIRAMALADRAGIYNINEKTSTPRIPAGTIEPDKLLEVLEWIDGYEKILDVFVESLPLKVLTIDYEDLLGNRNLVLAHTCQFLGISTFCPRDTVIKHTSDDLRQDVVNFDQLVSHFAGTGHAEMFFSDPVRTQPNNRATI